MAEYGSSGIWAVGRLGPWRHQMVEYSSLRLPDDLATRFRQWIEWYEQRLEDRPFDFHAFNAEGHRLALALKAFLGPECDIEYVAEREDDAAT